MKLIHKKRREQKTVFGSSDKLTRREKNTEKGNKKIERMDYLTIPIT